MKILETKQERKESAKAESENALVEIANKVEAYGKVAVEFREEDFKSELSTLVGWGFQDMKKEKRELITELVKNYKVEFYPIFDEDGFGVYVVVKKRKE